MALTATAPPDLMDNLTAGLTSLVPQVHVFLGFFRRGSVPILCTPDRDDWDRSYVLGGYLLDPLYEQFLRRDASTVLGPREMYPANFRDQDFYRHFYEPYGWRDKISVLGYVRPDIAGFVTLARRIDDPSFTASEQRVLRSVLPGVEQSTLRLWSLVARETAVEKEKGIQLDRVLRAAYESFGSDALSAREREVVRLLLKGLAPKAIGRMLEISPGTVRNHVKHIYAKLRVRSHAALLATFFERLDEAASRAITP